MKKQHVHSGRRPKFYKNIEEILLNIFEQIKDDYHVRKEYYDNADLKQEFKISDSTLWRWRRDHKIPYIKLGGTYYYPKSFIKNSLTQ